MISHLFSTSCVLVPILCVHVFELHILSCFFFWVKLWLVFPSIAFVIFCTRDKTKGVTNWQRKDRMWNSYMEAVRQIQNKLKVFDKSIIPNGFLQSIRAGLLTTINNNELIITNKPAKVPFTTCSNKIIIQKSWKYKANLGMDC
jgi:hypothetical protein